MLQLILGGCRSGKSRLAQRLAQNQDLPVVFVATCRTQGLDEEMQERVRKHRDDRPADWETVENEFNFETIAHRYPGHCILVDCLTLWISHWMGEGTAEKSILNKLDALAASKSEYPIHWIVVSNETGMGLVPETPEARAYRDTLGRANQHVAAMADTVDFCVAGIPLQIKPQ